MESIHLDLLGITGRLNHLCVSTDSSSCTCGRSVAKFISTALSLLLLNWANSRLSWRQHHVGWSYAGCSFDICMIQPFPIQCVISTRSLPRIQRCNRWIMDQSSFNRTSCTLRWFEPASSFRVFIWSSIKTIAEIKVLFSTDFRKIDYLLCARFWWCCSNMSTLLLHALTSYWRLDTLFFQHSFIKVATWIVSLLFEQLTFWQNIC